MAHRAASTQQGLNRPHTLRLLKTDQIAASGIVDTVNENSCLSPRFGGADALVSESEILD